MEDMDEDLQRAIKRVKNIKNKNDFCEILLKIHEGKIQMIEAKLKEKL